MPISQATILAIYGDLCDLVEKIDTLGNQATSPDLFTLQSDREHAVRLAIVNLCAAAHDAQQQAISHIIADDKAIHINPITGRTDE